MGKDLNLKELEGVRAGMTLKAKDDFYANNETIFSEMQGKPMSLEELSAFLGGADPYAVLENARNNPDLYSPEDIAWLEDQVSQLEALKGKRI